jgi:hypothetical protein
MSVIVEIYGGDLNDDLTVLSKINTDPDLFWLRYVFGQSTFAICSLHADL